jgi:hypothetical protein
MEGPVSMYESNPYMFEEEIEFTELDVSDTELNKLKALYEEGFITKGEYLTRRRVYLERTKF